MVTVQFMGKKSSIFGIVIKQKSNYLPFTNCVLGFSNEPLKGPLKGECQFINKFIIKLSSELILPPL